MNTFDELNVVDYIVFHVSDTSNLNCDSLQEKLDRTVEGSELAFVTEGEVDTFFNDDEEDEHSNELLSLHGKILSKVHNLTTSNEDEIEGGLIGVFLTREGEDEDEPNISHIFTVMRMVRESRGSVKLTDLSGMKLFHDSGVSIVYLDFNS